MPVIVPPVPMPAMTMSTLPSVSFQISSAVVLRWIAGLASLANWRAEDGAALLGDLDRPVTAPFIPVDGSVRTSSAPNARSSARRSLLIDSGIVRTTL